MDSYTKGRTRLKELLDAAGRGSSATLLRDGERFAVVDVTRLQDSLARLSKADTVVVPEDGGWSAFLPEVPVAADGESFDEAIADLIEALREYAEDWTEYLRDAANHQDQWGLVQLVQLSDDAQLREWLLAE